MGGCKALWRLKILSNPSFPLSAGGCQRLTEVLCWWCFPRGVSCHFIPTSTPPLKAKPRSSYKLLYWDLALVCLIWGTKKLNFGVTVEYSVLLVCGMSAVTCPRDLAPAAPISACLGAGRACKPVPAPCQCLSEGASDAVGWEVRVALQRVFYTAEQAIQSYNSWPKFWIANFLKLEICNVPHR